MFAKVVVTGFVLTALLALFGVQPSVADSVLVPSGQFAPVTQNPQFRLFGLGEGIEWVPGEGTVWLAGVDIPPRAQMTSLIVFCLDNVGPNATVQLYKVRGDGSPAQEIEVVVTGGTNAEPGTGYMATEAFRTEPRVDRDAYHYFVVVTMPPKPDDVHGILRVNAVEVSFEK